MAYHPQTAQRRPYAPFNLRAFSMRLSSLFRSFSQAFFQRVQAGPLVRASDWQGRLGHDRTRSESSLVAVPPTSVITRRRPLFADRRFSATVSGTSRNRHCLFWVGRRQVRSRKAVTQPTTGGTASDRDCHRESNSCNKRWKERPSQNDDRQLRSLLPVRRACLFAFTMPPTTMTRLVWQSESGQVQCK